MINVERQCVEIHLPECTLLQFFFKSDHRLGSLAPMGAAVLRDVETKADDVPASARIAGAIQEIGGDLL